jgi:hypothetical protein
MKCLKGDSFDMKPNRPLDKFKTEEACVTFVKNNNGKEVSVKLRYSGKRRTGQIKPTRRSTVPLAAVPAVRLFFDSEESAERKSKLETERKKLKQKTVNRRKVDEKCLIGEKWLS